MPTPKEIFSDPEIVAILKSLAKEYRKNKSEKNRRKHGDKN
jgi:hypothetical protein